MARVVLAGGKTGEDRKTVLIETLKKQEEVKVFQSGFYKEVRKNAEIVLRDLLELGCKPADLQEAMKTIEFPFYDDPKQQIESDYQPDAIKELSELAAAFADDYPTQKLILKWIDGEKDHMAWEAQYLNYIEKLGYENFLTAMM